MMLPTPTTPPTLSGTVSVGSTVVSSMVGTVTVKLLTPAGTVMLPSGFKTTPLLNTGAPMSCGLALPPPKTKLSTSGALGAALSVTV